MFVYLVMLPDWLPGLYLKVVVVGSSWSVSGRPVGGRVGSCMLLGLPFTLRAGVLPPTDVCVKLKRVVLVFSLSSALVVRLLGHVVVVGLDRARSGRRCRCCSRPGSRSCRTCARASRWLDALNRKSVSTRSIELMCAGRAWSGGAPATGGAEEDLRFSLPTDAPAFVTATRRKRGKGFRP